LREKVALIPGSASGIGRVTDSLLASYGAAVVVADITEGGGRETARMIEEAGGQAIFVRGDVTDPCEVDAMVHTAFETFYRLDILHANPGNPGVTKTLVDHDDGERAVVILVNLTGTY
jgi:NAD(P)-dependent dehydrogenase (short-subunit alcohol dehydrogenase family)